MFLAIIAISGGERVRASLWLNPNMLPSLGNVGIHAGNREYPGNWILSLGAVNAGLALCSCGTLGKGTLHMYPSFRVPSWVPVGVLVLTTRGFSMGGQGLGDRQDQTIGGRRKASEIEKKHAIGVSPREGTSSTPGRRQ